MRSSLTDHSTEFPNSGLRAGHSPKARDAERSSIPLRAYYWSPRGFRLRPDVFLKGFQGFSPQIVMTAGGNAVKVRFPSGSA